MSESTVTSTTVQVHRVYVRASAQAIWDAITDPEWNRRYGYQCAGEYDLRPGGGYRTLANDAMRDLGAPEVIITGEVVAVDPPHRLVQTWHPLFGPEIAAEGPHRLTWEIDQQSDGVCRLTVTHELDDAPMTAAQVGGELAEAGGGWSMILSDLKTLLETDRAFHES